MGRLAVGLAGLLVLLCLTAWATASRGASGTAAAAPCIKRTATAKPPPRLPPSPAKPKRGKERVETVPSERVCPRGQVPAPRRARRPTAKGNPLIGPVRGSSQLFFGSRRTAGSRVRKAVRSFRRAYASQGGPACNGVAYFGSCYYYGSAGFTRAADGGGVTMGIHRPAYDGSGGPGHSLDEISVQGGTSNGNIIELGWTVSTSEYPNAHPHLFVFHWIGWNPTCYNGCGWRQYSSTYAPGGDIDGLVGQEVYAGWVYYQGNWWAWFNNQWLGYFPGTEWPSGYTRNALIQWFGEVATANGTPPHTDMGNGIFPPDPAAARNATLCDVDSGAWACFYRDQQTTLETFPAYYKSARSGFGQVRYGGPGE